MQIRTSGKGTLRTAGRVAFELAVVFVGVLAALWVDNRREENARRERALRIADAISAEVTALTEWYGPWRDSVDARYRAWKDQVTRGERPPLFYFRVPGSEHVPVVGWQTGVSSGLLDVFEPTLVFEIGNTYHEWSDIGDRLARYHASTETLVFPELDAGGAGAYDGRTGRLRPAYAANLRLMEEILAEHDDKFARAKKMKEKVDSAVAVLRGRE